jgi:predicted dehydrogenase
MSQIRIAVIGADHLDPDHHIALNTLSERGLVAAFALDAEASDAGFAGLEQAMHQDELDAIIIAGQRADLGAWLQFVVPNEWPVYSTHPVPERLEEVVEIRRAERMAPLACVQFAFTARHHEAVSTALSKAGSGEYGNLLTLRGVCGIAGQNEGQNVVLDYGAQMLDIMQAFAGPFQDITGFADLDRTETPGSETNVFASLRTHSGVLASLHLSASQWRPTFRLELGFERGYLWVEGLNSERAHFGQEALIYARTNITGAQHETVERFEHSNGALVALQSFLARIGDATQPAIGTSQDAFDTLSTLQRILAADPIFLPHQERHVS